MSRKDPQAAKLLRSLVIKLKWEPNNVQEYAMWKVKHNKYMESKNEDIAKILVLLTISKY